MIFAENKDMQKGKKSSRRPRLDPGSWQMLLEAQVLSGLSVKDFCASQGISAISFYQ